MSRDPREFGIKVQRDKMKSPARTACKVFGRGTHAIRQVQVALGEAIKLLDDLHNKFPNMLVVEVSNSICKICGNAMPRHLVLVNGLQQGMFPAISETMLFSNCGCSCGAI